MSKKRSKQVAGAIGVLLALFVAAAVSARPSAPSQQGRPSESATMGPGMMGGMMPMMGDMSRMMQACTDMMNHMMSDVPTPPQPGPDTPAPKSETK